MFIYVKKMIILCIYENMYIDVYMHKNKYNVCNVYNSLIIYNISICIYINIYGIYLWVSGCI